tara:strand:+ start:46215 stop:47651 length:1437 start_codon:yes stop_codon:yes gene_type:complete
MKNKIIYGLAIVGVMASCTKKFDEMNVNKKLPTEAPAQALFANAAKDISRQVVTLNVNRNNLKLWSQYLTQTTYTDESNYDLRTRNIPQSEWRAMYREILKDLGEAKSYTNQEAWTLQADKDAQTNRLAIMEIYEIYCYERLTTIFGDIPYSEAFTESNLPKFDDAMTVYMDLDKRLTAAIGNLNSGAGSFDGGYDNLFGGDIDMWMKFAYGMKVKMAMTLADVDAAKAQTMLTSADGKVFGSGEQAAFTFMSVSPNTNPMWEDLVNSGRNDYVAANTIVDAMNTLDDPRRSAYFTMAPDTNVYIGGIYGASNSYSKYSHISSYFEDPTQPTVLMDYVEMEFYLAEAAARGLSVTGTAKEHYDNAITASIMNWGGTAADVSAYLANPTVDYTANTASWQEKIGTQSWIANFNRGMIGWTSFRRMDQPVLNVAANNPIATPTRYTYPTNEQTLNGANYSAAAAAIGGDLKSTKLWWDVN